MQRKTPALGKRMPSFQCFFQNNTRTIVEGGERRLIADSISDGNGMKKAERMECYLKASAFCGDLYSTSLPSPKMNIDLQQTDDESESSEGQASLSLIRSLVQLSSILLTAFSNRGKFVAHNSWDWSWLREYCCPT